MGALTRRTRLAVVAVVAAAGCTAVPGTGPTPTSTVATASGTTDPPTASAPPDGPTARPTPAATPAPTATATPVDPGRALAVAEALVEQVGERLPGTEADRAARTLVGDALAAAGWDVEQVEVPLPQGGTTANVVASRDGRGRDGVPHVVVGAHLDTVAGTVGANDNATGVGVLVAVAEELADEAATLAVPVVLVAFGAEEYQADTGVHHVGSEHLAATGPAPVAMLSVDMVGNGPTTRAVGLEGTTTALVDRLVDVAARAGIPDVVADQRGDISDHGPFARRDLPAAFLWSGPDGRLHTAADTAEHLDPVDLGRAGNLVLAWVRDLTAADADGLRTTRVLP